MTPFDCPFCSFVSHNPTDIEEQYCSRCHIVTTDILEAKPEARRVIADLYRKLALESSGRIMYDANFMVKVWEYGLPTLPPDPVTQGDTSAEHAN